MKIIFSSSRRRHVARAIIFLISIALIAGIAGCAPAQYTLTISSTEGGEVTAPGEETFTYNEGTVVNLVAEAEEGYRFVDWTGYVRAIADVTAAATNITMNDSYSITANFALDICLEIRDWYDLAAVRDNLCVSYILMNDLDSTTPGYEELASPTANGGQGWEPIGAWKHPFRGIFNGRGYEICDMFISRPSEGGVGFFGSVGEAGAIKDIGVMNVTVVTGDECVGGLVGYNRGTVSNCYSTGNVTGDFQVGGLVGRNYGTVRNSYSIDSVSGDVEVGGLVGGNEHEWEGIEGTVSDSYSTGSVTGSGCVGGLVGLNSATVSDSYSTGSVTGEDDVGGLVGENGGTVNNSYSIGNVTGEEHVGGLAGHSAGTVSNSYSTGSVTGYEDVGGLVGYNNGPVSNSYYNYDEVLINDENIITVGALFNGDFDQWLANGKFLNVDERLSQENGYYLINDVADFKQLLAFGQNDTLKFRLKNDLDLGDEPNFHIPYLAGEFDGNGHKISNLSLDYDLVSPLGLFGYLARGGKVTRVGVEKLNVTGTLGVGGLVGRNRGTVRNSYSTGNVSGNGDIGGLVGSNWGTMSNSYSIGSVTGNIDVGGLVGYNVGDVISSYSTGSVTGEECVGGLVGMNDGPVINCYSSDNVTGNVWVGGLLGFSEWVTVSNCYAMGNVTGDSGVGGLVGGNDCTVRNSYSTGSVTGNVDVGGLVGRNWGTMVHSFWDIETSGQASSDGGIGKTTAEMQDIATFSGAGWNIIAVAPGESNDAYTWNIIDKQNYPFLSWEL
jgi:hypothetical protein